MSKTSRRATRAYAAKLGAVTEGEYRVDGELIQVHFFNAAGDEVVYWSKAMDAIHTFDEPRRWSPMSKDRIKIANLGDF